MSTPRTVAVFLFLSGGAIAQVAQPSVRPQFEVASIKLAPPDAFGMWIRPIAGGTTMTNMTLKELIVIAYRIQPFQVSGGPAWLDSARFDISAKSEGPRKPGEIPLMLQALLEDRFKLAMHRDTKELPIYALVLAKKDHTLGPRLTESKEGSCTEDDPSKPPPPPEPGKPSTLGCGGVMTGPRQLTAASVPLARLISALERRIGRTIVDKTGLTGNFDIVLQWTPDENELAVLALLLPPDEPRPSASDSTGPSIFTALQEQLGLKLESQKGPVEILVIDRAPRNLRKTD